eukprot:2888575-Pyramimonas_sp.AAC.1
MALPGAPPGGLRRDATEWRRECAAAPSRRPQWPPRHPTPARPGETRTGGSRGGQYTIWRGLEGVSTPFGWV